MRPVLKRLELSCNENVLCPPPLRLTSKNSRTSRSPLWKAGAQHAGLVELVAAKK
jgi:hypothetical protein